MKDLNNYIIEKLHLNKDIETLESISFNDLITFLNKNFFDKIKNFNRVAFERMKGFFEDYKDNKFFIYATEDCKEIWKDNKNTKFIKYISKEELDNIENKDIKTSAGDSVYFYGGIWYIKNIKDTNIVGYIYTKDVGNDKSDPYIFDKEYDPIFIVIDND